MYKNVVDSLHSFTYLVVVVATLFLIMSEEIKKFSLAEIAKNNGKDTHRTWIIYKDSVYDVSDYLEEVSWKNIVDCFIKGVIKN